MASRLLHLNKRTEILLPEHLIHQCADAVHVLVPDLHEDAAAVGEKIVRHGQTVAQVGEIGVDAVAPRVAEGAHLLWLARDVVLRAVLHVAARGAPLEVRVEPDAIGRVEIDALHLAAQALALGEARHHVEAVARDHAVRPVLVVRVKLGLRFEIGQAVEVGEEVGHRLGTAVLPRLRLPAQVVDQHLRVHLLLDVERRRGHHEVRPVLLVLAAPHELRIEVAIAPLIGDADRRLVRLRHHALELRRGDVLARGVRVRERLDAEGFFGHAYSSRRSGFARDFLFSDAIRLSTFLTSSAGERLSGRIPRLIRVLRTSALLVTCSAEISRSRVIWCARALNIVISVAKSFAFRMIVGAKSASGRLSGTFH